MSNHVQPGSTSVQLHPSWLAVLEQEFEQPYMQGLKAFLLDQKQQGKVIFPPAELYFNALNSTPLDQVRVVIIGQDPYHGPGQAHGLCFSVQQGVKPPPSLQNIFKEIVADAGLDSAKLQSGCLDHWAGQGVLLLNSVLTVEQGNAGAHQGKGWEIFTDRVIEAVSDNCEHVVFMLWGAYAQKKGAKIDRLRHLVLQAPHPSPLSAYRGFMGCGHFSRCNAYLHERDGASIDWSTSTPGGAVLT